MIAGLVLIGLACVVRLFAGVYTDHRQTCRRRRRAFRTGAVAAVRHLDFEDNFKVIGGSGGRR
jgi:hypothetical protein